MRVIIYVRSNVPWETITLSNYLEHPGHTSHICRQKLRDEMLHRIRWWNELFGMSYFQFRRELRDISTVCFDNMAGVDAIVRDYEVLLKLIRHDRETWILPTDDDDWYAPELASLCKRFSRERCDLLTWGQQQLWSSTPPINNYKRHARELPLQSDPCLRTNVYAVTSDRLNSAGPWARWYALNSHERVLHCLKEERRGCRIAGLSYYLSVTHKSMASYSSLSRIKTQQQFLDAMLGSRDLLHEQSYPGWAEPYVAQVDQLLKRLLYSRSS